MRTNTTIGPKRVIAYTRVSAASQVETGLGLAAQRAAIEAATAQRGWELLSVAEDAGKSAKTVKGRTALESTLAMLDAGEADALCVAKLDRLSRSIMDFAVLMERARSNGWGIVVLDLDFDMTTPTGELMANMVAAFAQFERRVIGQRTKDALAVKRENGIILGRPRTVSERVVQRMARERAAGNSYPVIARGLNDDCIPTGQGGREWYPSTVRAALLRWDSAAA